MDTPSIRGLRTGPGRTLIVTWKGGAESPVAVGAQLDSYAVFVPLRSDAKAFDAVRVGEWGWNAHWSETMEISADTLWRLALEQGAAWLRAWRKARVASMTQAEAARALGVSVRMWRYYEAGTHLLPKTVRLAAIGLDHAAEAA